MAIRVQFEINEGKFKELEELMKKVGIKTKKDLLNNALTLLEWAVNERKAGRIIASIDEEEQKYKEVIMPILSNV
ncbi:MAG: hypothetical protein ACOZF2_15275 [Thermodesulfobacteriota bacterium]